MKKLLEEFKAFIVRGNVVDMAVGVIIATAFGKIVTSLVNDIFMPIIGVLIGNMNFSDLQGSPNLISKEEKSTFPIIIPMTGINISLTKLVTIFPKAPAIITPIAISSTFPRITNALNSSNNFFIKPPKN